MFLFERKRGGVEEERSLLVVLVVKVLVQHQSIKTLHQSINPLPRGNMADSEGEESKGKGRIYMAVTLEHHSINLIQEVLW